MNATRFYRRSAGFVAALMLGLCAVVSTAQAQTQTPTEVIRQSVDSLMSELEGKKDYYAQHEDELAQLVDSNMAQVADFRYIGASVMGRYFRAATPEQRSRFVKVFRKTLIDTYAKGLVTFDYKTLRVKDAEDTGRYEDQASVPVEVVSTTGKTYPVSFTLRQSDGQWKVINVIVNGINLGLTFRNQFDQSMRDNDRDFDKVIDNWAPKVDTDQLEKGGDS
ncbi:ABC transporter substrate-binding protein [Salinicola endophyticus]|uniref:ABC transporter substrate-binding protein n=1 Tax=Salinicola endophyticus TaxID=1949083 RepID=A0ABY8FLE0_9GAMM|nr:MULTISPECIES: ABC transporter substrate-binding protein [Salinicola]WFF43347.1 ABC transporter substrate-binding protein [Salinicola endophyticus]